ncbi:MAG: undecaprenyl/decaprenyl-phosphate alpha-N-acetylglucosaminyl 1-phosphate transferase [Clostridiales bacterium]|nr:undecaprenyl/decaprenyl-phosphate alpha-N-acetylglucosaminyl 1-phosphate transferase [Clostridiales bacterium]
MSFVLTFIISFAISLAIYPLVRRLAFFSNAISVPTKERHIHKKPVPLLGGLSIITGFLIAILMNFLLNSNFIATRELLGLVCGIAIIVVMGVLDDILELNPLVKLFFQISAAITAILISGSRIEFFTNPNALTSVILLNPVFSFAITIFWIVALTNAFNLVDGLDGLSAGTGAICAITLFVVSLIRPDAELLGSYAAIVTIALAGSALGFLPFNFNPAKIFMGESGSAFIGFTLAMVSMQGTLKSYTALSVFIPVVAFGLPLLDAVLAFFRRSLKGKPFYKGDRQHIHHKLTDDLGLSQKTTVLILYTASIILGVMSIIMARNGMKNILVLLISMAVVLIAVIAFIYKPPKYIVGKQASQKSNIPENEKETIDDE